MLGENVASADLALSDLRPARKILGAGERLNLLVGHVRGLLPRRLATGRVVEVRQRARVGPADLPARHFVLRCGEERVEERVEETDGD